MDGRAAELLTIFSFQADKQEGVSARGRQAFAIALIIWAFFKKQHYIVCFVTDSYNMMLFYISNK